MKTQVPPRFSTAVPVDPALVPQRVLYSGARMPAIGLGTFGSDHVSPSEVAEAVEGAAAVGYRHFDCASVYGNEAQIGYALQQILHLGINREQLWITSKLWNDKHGENDVIPSCRQSLADLRLDYLDLLAAKLLKEHLVSHGWLTSPRRHVGTRVQMTLEGAERARWPRRPRAHHAEHARPDTVAAARPTSG